MRLDEYIGVIVKRTDLKLNNYYQKVCSPYNITIDQWMILVVLWEEEGLTQNELAERTYKDKTNIARMLFLLEERGFIHRETDKKDRRSLRVYLTEKGRLLKDEVLPPSIEAYEKTVAGLTEEEVNQFRRTLNIIYENVKNF
ncbi:MarR family winged helix-turn-helix transcriptional regulator [Brevibacillus sp. HB2.2]|uniref:MarR family winged helix-turn-helix transcriptional regulator n=1 Tax=Brevibacillus sp. HB2.2 TaxID=2738846 RepID=UPI00156BD244|nr:MarR family transcriptional regulator [Brevibacillus sp. HB2.2]NRS47049.1 MarR family transcriptional regulator [Brevibacillus sp. HB2.2]